MNDIKAMSENTDHKLSTPSAPAAPATPSYVTKKDGPQSGTPGSDAIIDTVKLLGGNKDNSKTMQTSEP
jgi:hypothetical protein